MKSKETKRSEAIARQRIYEGLNPVEKLERLDKRLGLNKGAKKERKRLEAQLKEIYGGK